tara:strand:- start:34 stop:162 length:129 start_codon:yes stop_codon:yes gene_type:complete
LYLKSVFGIVRWLNCQAAYRGLFEYIEIFYNRERSHSTLHRR